MRTYFNVTVVLESERWPENETDLRRCLSEEFTAVVSHPVYVGAIEDEARKAFRDILTQIEQHDIGNVVHVEETVEYVEANDDDNI